MRKKLKTSFIYIAIIVSVTTVFSQNLSDYSLEAWESNLPLWGHAWKAGDDHVNGYYPSFYVGFAPRTQTPDRLHIRTSRGSQTRVSVILDDEEIKNYLFDLYKRASIYKDLTSDTNGRLLINTSPRNSELPANLNEFLNIVNSSAFEIAKTVTESLDARDYDSEAFYVKSLETMSQLNAGRIFNIDLNLNEEFSKWAELLKSMLQAENLNGYYNNNPKNTIIALNSMVWGRVNYTKKPSAEIIEKLTEVSRLVVQNDLLPQEFFSAALDLFKDVTEDKYDFNVIKNNAWTSAINCSDAQCFLTYPEFTAIYPTGSFKGHVQDEYKNSIPNFVTPGLWNFLDRGYHEVDNIRSEPYYGWAPKMDFEGIGNGFHNPAVRFSDKDLNRDVRSQLNIKEKLNQYWAVMRGGVSSGCLRLALGHVWELRHIFPVENSKMKEVFFFGNNSADFDLFDIDGDGSPEIMGVEYFVSYDLKGSSGLAKREGAALDITSENIDAYYSKLYGKNSVFEKNEDTYEFINPNVSFPSHLDLSQKSTKTSFKVPGRFPLYEQNYEKDKVQMYAPFSTQGLDSKGQSPLVKRLVRLMGRIRGCAPSADKANCGEQSFTDEFNAISSEAR